MTLIQLPALDGSCDHVCYRGKKGYVVVVKLASLFCVRAEHAIGPAIAAGNRRGEPADHAVIMQQGRARKPRLAREVLHDRWPAGGTCVAGLGIAAGRDVRRPDEAWLPSNAG